MKLEMDWFTKYPDAEYQKYILMAFLRDVKQDFKSNILYPHITDIDYHLKNLEKWTYSRELFFKKSIKGIDFEKMTLIYDTPEDSTEMSEINETVEFATQMLRKLFKQGRVIWRSVESQMVWKLIGIVPIYKSEGFIMLKVNKEVIIYRYDVKPIVLEQIPNSQISLTEVMKEEYGLGVYESLKLKLMKETDLPAPLTIAVETNSYPVDSTLLPIIKTIALSKIKNI